MMCTAVYCSGLTGRRSYLAALLVLVIFSHLKTAEPESISCKNKVRNTWLKFCIGDGVKVKRDAAVLVSRFNRRTSGEDGIGVPADPPARFPPPLRGDDLGMGMSVHDAEGLYEEMIGRMTRAPKDNKDQVIKTLTEYAAKCCNENLEDATCSDPTNVISCP